MTTNQKKGKHVRLYILEEDEPLLEALAEATRLSQTAIMTLLVSAGLKACAENGNRIPLPLSFEVLGPTSPYRMNEPSTQAHKRK